VEFRTRLGTAQDAEAINAVFSAGVETYAEFAGDGWEPPVPDVDDTRRMLLDPRTWAMLAVVDGEPVAHFSFMAARERAADDNPRDWLDRPLIPGMAHLWQLFVLPDWWGTGVAAWLHERGVAEMRAQRYECGRLYTPSAHARARRFYERRCWRPFADYESTDFGLPLTEYRLDL
jgi:GNAT superfamily N-acetyltransferase